MANKTKIMTVSVEPDLHDMLVAQADREDCSVSRIVRKIVRAYYGSSDGRPYVERVSMS